MKDEELDASTKLGKAEKLAKMKNMVVMAYMTQCLSITAMLNGIFNVQAEADWLTGRACQLFANLMKHANQQCWICDFSDSLGFPNLKS